ncbi:MAG: hypothetical protein E2O54_07660 [Gammaproteobacteria bacterium]|nr:MAG: hypothetical protein E2O54_07660 [Gammaproteobacteria bacterium]
MEKPSPPTNLDPYGARQWRAIVDAHPWNRFLAAPVQIQLGLYCKSSSRCHDLATALDAADPASKTFLQLANLEVKQSGLLMALARSLGVSQQQTLKHEVAATASKRNAPTIVADLVNFRDDSGDNPE